MENDKIGISTTPTRVTRSSTKSVNVEKISKCRSKYSTTSMPISNMSRRNQTYPWYSRPIHFIFNNRKSNNQESKINSQLTCPSTSTNINKDGNEYCHDKNMSNLSNENNKNSIDIKKDTPTFSYERKDITSIDNNKRRFSLARFALKKFSYIKKNEKVCLNHETNYPVQCLYTDENESPSISDSIEQYSNNVLDTHNNSNDDEYIKKYKLFYGAFKNSGIKKKYSYSKRKRSLGPSMSLDPNKLIRDESIKIKNDKRRHSIESIQHLSINLVDDTLIDKCNTKSIVKCYHCQLIEDCHAFLLKTELENAVIKLANNLKDSSCGYSHKPWLYHDYINESKKKFANNTQTTNTSTNTGDSPIANAINAHARSTPDIVVSSICSEDDDNDITNKNSENGSSIANSSPNSPIICNSPSTTIQLYNTVNHKYITYPEINSHIEGITSIHENTINNHSDGLIMNEQTTLNIINEKKIEKDKTNFQQMDCLKLPSNSLTSSTHSDSGSPPRSNSIDLSTLRRDIEMYSVSSNDSECGGGISDFESDYCPTPAESIRTIRSKSYDPSSTATEVLRRGSRIDHLSEMFRKALAKSPVAKRAVVEDPIAKTITINRTSNYWFSNDILSTDHIWTKSTGLTSSSTIDTECYAADKGCYHAGDKRRCLACHIVIHNNCTPLLSRNEMGCKPSYYDMTDKKNKLLKCQIENIQKHHWVHRWRCEGRCAHCGKSFQQKRFREKDIIALTCSWCKLTIHSKKPCFNIERLEEDCDFGQLGSLILPPSWLLKLPNNKKKHRQPPNTSGLKNKDKRKTFRFIVKPIDCDYGIQKHPLLVFVNPKSGGNKGAKALQTFCWLLNPRQVFDITALKGPKFGLEVFRKIGSRLRILICGGDGTVGWVLSTLDSLNWPIYPPMAVMPLGTGNDLSRCMGWGGVFNDEPLSQLLKAIVNDTSITYLDRWKLNVQPNANVSLDNGEEINDALQSSLPLTVMNNYFSIGADAHVALQFHHSRSANPQMLNSRFKNRIAYGGLGTIDLFKRAWKDLTEYINVECDGISITQRLKDSKFHCILFHNITYYGGGTTPWGNEETETMQKQSCCDGKIEVLGFTTATLAALQMGGKGERIAQCSSAKITTTKAIPMQVDGEPCLLAPSTIFISFHNKVPMLKKEKKSNTTPGLIKKNKNKLSVSQTNTITLVNVKIPVIVVGKEDFDMYRDSFDRLKDTAFELGIINVEAELELEQVRIQVQKLLSDHPALPYEPEKDWSFLDYVSNSEEGTFKVSKHYEISQTVADICNVDDCIVILDDSFPSLTERAQVIGNDLAFTPSIDYEKKPSTTEHSLNEALRLVLNSDQKETHL
ncbi:Diacylglycerol kinase [Strongyloides ratti]|uniref:Diacylglycerol kinase n=1 Tax=Strongyloides ratti TaxID=34506 RepID=A0A090KWZ8_STRRB|nr:Diacylglycerol kinase [Strongyloides ratti]CEF60397.1 Diacylglycerol kinase [Strongyloides ratti]